MAGPNTRAIGNQIVSYLAALTYPSTAPVYALAQLEEIKDVIGIVSAGNACVEVVCGPDSSRGATFGGGIWDEQTWLICSMVGVNTAAQAAAIYDVRDALVAPFGTHYQLGNVISGLFWSRLKPNSGQFLRFDRGIDVQAHIIELETRLAWGVTLSP